MRQPELTARHGAAERGANPPGHGCASTWCLDNAGARRGGAVGRRGLPGGAVFRLGGGLRERGRAVGAARGADRAQARVRPLQENKVLRTVPLLEACLPQDKCKVKIGRRFSEERDTELSTVCRKSGTLIFYPGAEATNLEEFILDSPVYPSTIIIIDGTWSQAKDIFYKNSLFRFPKQVQLKTTISSQYVIRMQPTNRCLSTLECAAVALSILEKNNSILETLLRPLQALCSFQLQHGAQIRLSKEYLLKNGLYPKPMPKNKRKLRKMELLMNSVKI
ncbi:DTW domain-containing protein 2 isoform X2 [Octodon degus]|uniref:tRNA-uridine aminocarboxypropyltransferase n=1 Tax=Octodon degus TaxID=10160 RepID=A0A6P6D8D8_OCTDE|nr:DTW domain-containing protein 2 isoform X2 [Octodon degus]